jgi:CheY-like chemotaxis protein/anti-sigma regulatory factor (Ser/Thr protein kinase)
MADLARVVVVDDVLEMRRLLRTALRFGGGGRFAVVGAAGTGAEAVALAARLQPQILVLDLGLPDLSGHQLVTRIREAAPYAKIVVFSGGAPDDVEWFARRTAGYVLKDQLDLLVDTLVAIAEPPGEDSSSVSLPCDAASLAIAREHVRHQLHAWSLPSLVDVAVLVTSELAANAVQHGRSGFDLRLEVRNAHALRVEVFDHGPGSPELRAADPDSEDGRGLHLVSQLAASWGVESIVDDGKKVWAELLVD